MVQVAQSLLLLVETWIEFLVPNFDLDPIQTSVKCFGGSRGWQLLPLLCFSQLKKVMVKRTGMHREADVDLAQRLL